MEGKQRFVVQKEWRKPTKRLQIWNADKGKQNKINVGGLSEPFNSRVYFSDFPNCPLNGELACARSQVFFLGGVVRSNEETNRTRPKTLLGVCVCVDLYKMKAQMKIHNLKKNSPRFVQTDSKCNTAFYGLCSMRDMRTSTLG